MPRAGRDFLGTGLPAWAVALVLFASTAVFALWDKPLWLATREDTHLGRILVSYLSLLPFAAVALLAARRLATARLVTLVLLTGAAKMLLTAGSWFFVGPGHANRYEPRPVAASEAQKAKRGRTVRGGGEIVALEIRDGRYGAERYEAAVGDTLIVENLDGALHTVHVYRDGQSIKNAPAPAGKKTQILELERPGRYLIEDDLDDAVRAELVVAPRSQISP